MRGPGRQWLGALEGDGVTPFPCTPPIHTHDIRNKRATAKTASSNEGCAPHAQTYRPSRHDDGGRGAVGAGPPPDPPQRHAVHVVAKDQGHDQRSHAQHQHQQQEQERERHARPLRPVRLQVPHVLRRGPQVGFALLSGKGRKGTGLRSGCVRPDRIWEPRARARAVRRRFDREAVWVRWASAKDG